MYKLKLLNRISHKAEIRNILLKHGTKWMKKSKIVLSNKSNDPTTQNTI